MEASPSSPGRPVPSAATPISPRRRSSTSGGPALIKKTSFQLELDASVEHRLASPASPSVADSNATTLSTASSLSPQRAVQLEDVLTEFPSSDPASPALLALAMANEKTDPSLLDKRMRIGKTKLGRTKYKEARSFKKPEGNEINFQHEQYALTYGMMCGILNSAGLQNPFKQKLTMDDFMRVDKHCFPASAKLRHPFKFKDYSPDIFRQIRRRFCIDSADYMVTLCGDFNFIEFMSNSKSGQFFFYSHDGRFMIKTQTKDESKFLRRILPHYYKFVMENPNTLITRFYGMHRVKMHHLRRKMHFIIMASVFDTPCEIHGRFDLKGSKVGRRASAKERNSNGVLKDMDLLESGFRLQMSPERRAMLLVQVRKDVEFLKRMKIMDYSMLIGVYDSRQAIQAKIYAAPAASSDDSKAAAQVSKSLPTSPIGTTSSGDDDAASAATHGVDLGDLQHIPVRMTRSISLPKEPAVGDSSDSQNRLSEPTLLALLSPAVSQGHSSHFDSDSDSDVSESSDESMPVEGGGGAGAGGSLGMSGLEPLSPSVLDVTAFPGKSESVFCKDEGGIFGRDRFGRKNGFVYFLGIIDILQQYNTRKIAETFFKGFRHNRKQISSVHPNFYGDRFIEFVEQHVVQDDTLPPPPVFVGSVALSALNTTSATATAAVASPPAAPAAKRSPAGPRA